MRNVTLEDMSPELQARLKKELRIRKPREQSLSADRLRGWAFRLLAVIAPLSTSDRDRVLKHAARLNRINVREPKGKQ